jgi:replicative DNA helicase
MPEGDLQQLTSYLPDIHRLLPASPDAEQGLLSSFLIAPMHVGGLCDEKGLQPQHFHIPAHGTIYGAMMDMWRERLSIDVITLTQRLRDQNLLQNCGGPAFVTQLFTFMPTAANATFYLEIMREKWTLRCLIRICTEIAARCYEEQDMVTELVDTLQAEANMIALEDARSPDECSTVEVLTAAMSQAEQGLLENSDGLTTGIEVWDTNLAGVRNGQMYALGARPKVGKTSLIETMMDHQMTRGHRVLCFQRDMSTVVQLNRMACRRAGVIYEDFFRRTCPDTDIEKVMEALRSFDSNLLRLYSPREMTSRTIRRIVNMEMRQGLGAIYIDVFQRIKALNPKAGIAEGLTEASKDLRDLCLEHNIPLIVVAHMNREADWTKRPNAGQFKYCDQLFGDCDVAILMWSKDDPAKLQDRYGNWKRQEIILTVDANRAGYVGDERIYFDRPHMTFYRTLQSAD